MTPTPTPPTEKNWCACKLVPPRAEHSTFCENYTPTEKCCEKCYVQLDDSYGYECRDSNCPCHTTDTGWVWEDEEPWWFKDFRATWFREKHGDRKYPDIRELIQHIAKEEYARGRKDLTTEIRIAMEVTKAQGYEDFSNRVLQLVDGLEALETQP